jgi:hypothetical protein
MHESGQGLNDHSAARLYVARKSLNQLQNQSNRPASNATGPRKPVTFNLITLSALVARPARQTFV